MNFRIVDADGKELAMSRDFQALRAQFADQSKTVFSTLHRNRLEQDDLVEWPQAIDELPESVNFEREQGVGAGKTRVRYDGYPAFVDRGTTVSVVIFDERLEAAQAHVQGLTRLFMLMQSDAARFVERSIRISPTAAFQYSSFVPAAKNHAQEALRQELLFAAFRATFVDAEEGELRFRAQFQERMQRHKAGLSERAAVLTRAIDEALSNVAEVRKRCEDRYIKGWEHIGADIAEQLDHLFAPGFLRITPSAQLLHYPRYLKAIIMRLEKAKQGAMERDLEQHKQIKPLWQRYLAVRDAREPRLQGYRWAIEELRVGLYAQELRTPQPVSVKRLGKMWEELENLL
jgi:ATP-dependent helicase HrpA